MKTNIFSVDQAANFLRYHFTERKKDADQKIIPMIASNNSIVTTDTDIVLPDGSTAKAAPVIGLLEAYPRSFGFRVSRPRMRFKTGVFLHWKLFEDYILTGKSQADSTYIFELKSEGLSITDVAHSKTNHFDIEALKGLGIIGAEWDYLKKSERWFESDFKAPTGVKASGYFLADLGKIPTRLVTGEVVKNSDVWVMS
ncbi:MAG: hypothetical protein ACPGFK_00610 [Flavobacteriaceae bacterium]